LFGTLQPPTCSKSHDHLSLGQKCKKGVGHAKKVLNLGGTAKNKLALEDNLTGWEEEEEEEIEEEKMEKGTHTSSKGQLDSSNNNTVVPDSTNSNMVVIEMN
jgi:hypothetical protein